MFKRVLRAALGVIFFFVFLLFLLTGAMKFRVLSAPFWKTALDKGGVYPQLQGQVSKFRAKVESDLRKQAAEAGTSTKAVEAFMTSGPLASLFSLDKWLTESRFRELIETNIDRLFGYLDGKEKNLELFLPVKAWNLPVEGLGMPGVSRWTEQTSLEDVLPVLGMKPEQVKSSVEAVVMLRTIVSYSWVVFFGLLLLVVGLLGGHYLLGLGLVDRINGTSWLLMISGFTAKLIGIGADNVFGFFAANSKPPMEPWVADLGRSLVGQFFNLGATIGLLVGVVGLGTLFVMFFLVKGGKVKDETEKMSLKKRMLAFILGVILGFVILGATVIGVMLAMGGKVDFKATGGSVNIGSQTKEDGAKQEGLQKLSEIAYRSDKGWQMNFPAGWDPLKGGEGVNKKPLSPTDWAMIEVKMASRFPEIDSGGYLSGMKYILESGKTNLKNAVFVEEPYEEVQQNTNWKRFVFTFDFDQGVSGKTFRLRILKVEYYPPKTGDGFIIMATMPVESWSKYEKIVRESVDTFKIGK